MKKSWIFCLIPFTPKFSHFLVGVNDREFVYERANFVWHLSEGKNRIEVWSVNSLGVKGPSSIIELIT